MRAFFTPSLAHISLECILALNNSAFFDKLNCFFWELASAPLTVQFIYDDKVYIFFRDGARVWGWYKHMSHSLINRTAVGSLQVEMASECWWKNLKFCLVLGTETSHSISQGSWCKLWSWSWSAPQDGGDAFCTWEMYASAPPAPHNRLFVY